MFKNALQNMCRKFLVIRSAEHLIRLGRGTAQPFNGLPAVPFEVGAEKLCYGDADFYRRLACNRQTENVVPSSLITRAVSSPLVNPTKIIEVQRRCNIHTSVRNDSDHIFEVENGDDFMDRVVASRQPVLVDFYADWCGPCQNLSPRLEAKINGQNGKVLLAKINVDAIGDGLTDQFNVSALPTVIAFKDGDVFYRFEGDVEDTLIDELLENLTWKDDGNE